MGPDLVIHVSSGQRLCLGCEVAAGPCLGPRMGTDLVIHGGAVPWSANGVGLMIRFAGGVRGGDLLCVLCGLGLLGASEELSTSREGAARKDNFGVRIEGEGRICATWGWISVDRGSKATLPLTMPRRVFKSSAKDSARRPTGIMLQGGRAGTSAGTGTPTARAHGSRGAPTAGRQLDGGTRRRC